MKKMRANLEINKCIVCSKEYVVTKGSTHSRKPMVRSNTTKTCSKECSKEFTRNRNKYIKGKKRKC